jgi:ABC-type iron transport system FetAB ATPase subunit
VTYGPTPSSALAPGKLFGGERRRLCLLRTLAARPAALLLDEPTEGLDSHAARRTLTAITRHLPETGALFPLTRSAAWAVSRSARRAQRCARLAYGGVCRFEAPRLGRQAVE